MFCIHFSNVVWQQVARIIIFSNFLLHIFYLLASNLLEVNETKHNKYNAVKNNDCATQGRQRTLQKELNLLPSFFLERHSR